MENYKEKTDLVSESTQSEQYQLHGCSNFYWGHQAQAAEDTHQNVDKPTQTQELTQSVQKKINQLKLRSLLLKRHKYNLQINRLKLLRNIMMNR